MMAWASSGVMEMPFLVKVTVRVAPTVTSPATSARLTRTEPFTPAAPSWMCERLIGVPAGRLEMGTVKSAVAAVICPPTTVVLNVIDEVPVPPASAPTIAGFSLFPDNVAVNFGCVAEGAVGVSSPHPAASRLTVMARAADQRFIRLLLQTLTGQVDAEIQDSDRRQVADLPDVPNEGRTGRASITRPWASLAPRRQEQGVDQP